MGLPIGLQQPPKSYFRGFFKHLFTEVVKAVRVAAGLHSYFGSSIRKGTIRIVSFTPPLLWVRKPNNDGSATKYHLNLKTLLPGERKKSKREHIVAFGTEWFNHIYLRFRMHCEYHRCVVISHRSFSSPHNADIDGIIYWRVEGNENPKTI